LQAALWREAFSLVEQGVCSAEDVDVAITSGPGLRWALFGPYINMQLANQKGFKEAIHHLGLADRMVERYARISTFRRDNRVIGSTNQPATNTI
jgi:3-hydroxyacyl-CoA dehydrogenase